MLVRLDPSRIGSVSSHLFFFFFGGGYRKLGLLMRHGSAGKEIAFNACVRTQILCRV